MSISKVVIKECSKCGSATHTMQYDDTLDKLQIRCFDCGFQWAQFPQDQINSVLKHA